MPGENEKVQAFAPRGIENAGVDISFTVPANGWSENSPYTYTWTNSNILLNSRVTVSFASENSSTDVIYLDCEKVTGGIQLTSSVKPSAALYLVAHIVNAKMDSYADVHGDMVATDIITGASNVDEALENLDTRVDALNSNIATINENVLFKAYSFSVTGSTAVWTSPIRYKDVTIELPSVPRSPNQIYAVSHNNQFWVASVTGSDNSKNVTLRVLTVATSDLSGIATVWYQS